MKNRLPLLLFFIILIIKTVAAIELNLANYPSPFVSQQRFDALIVVGDDSPAGDTLAATTIATNLQLITKEKVPSAMLESEVTRPYAQHLILIGDCSSKLIAEVKKSDSCYTELDEEVGIIELYQKNNIAVLIVGGKSSAARRKAASALAQYSELDLIGDKVFVRGTIDEPKISYEQPQFQEEPKEIIEKTICSSDEDCKANEFCSQFGCLQLECPAGFVVKNHSCEKEIKKPPEIIEKIISVTEEERLQKESITAEKNETTEITEPQKKSFIEKILSWLLSLFK
jgi:hypothetical protein